MTDQSWGMSDHDLLIQVRTILDRMDREYSSERREMWERFGHHETRIRKLEDLNAALQPEKAHARYDRWGTEWEQFQSRLGVYGSLAGVFGGAVVLLAQLLIGKLW